LAKESQSSNGSTIKAPPATKLKTTHEDTNLSGPIEALGTKMDGLDTSNEDDSGGDTADKPLPSLGFSSRDGLSRTNSSNKVQARSSMHSGLIAQILPLKSLLKLKRQQYRMIPRALNGGRGQCNKS
jgi:hypothetical protein